MNIIAELLRKRLPKGVKTGKTGDSVVRAEGETCVVCAIGTIIANDTRVTTPTGIRTSWMFNTFSPKIKNAFRTLACNPVTQTTERLDGIIAKLFERHNWSKKRIAEWVETLEL